MKVALKYKIGQKNRPEWIYMYEFEVEVLKD